MDQAACYFCGETEAVTVDDGFAMCAACEEAERQSYEAAAKRAQQEAIKAVLLDNDEYQAWLDYQAEVAVIQTEVWADWDACRSNEANWSQDEARNVVLVAGDEPPF